MNVNSIENELVILTKQTIDVFLRSKNPADIMSLYTFYYYTAKWQETNQPKCTTNYVAKGLKWSEAKVRRSKKELVELGLVEDIQQKDESGKILGHYIKLNYIIKQSTIQTMEKPQGGTFDSVENLQTNALSTGIQNSLSAGNKNALSDDIKNIVDYLNEKAGTKFRPSSKVTQKHIHARLSEGFTVEDFRVVIDKKCDDWKGTDWEQYLRPETIFGTKFESYLNAPIKKRKTYGASGIEIDVPVEDDLPFFK